MAEPQHPRRAEWLVTAPSFGWLLALFVIPAVIVLAIAFKPPTPYGGIGEGWSLETLRSLGNPNYPAIVWRTVWLAFVTTAICLLLAIPVGYYIARVRGRVRDRLLLLVIVPFWTSFLVRIFAWKVLLHPEGPVKRFLVMAGLAAPEATLLYSTGAILLVLVYTELPFAILPIYAAAEKFDYRLIEAARDLGAGAFRAFVQVFLPSIRRGVLTAALVTLIPALGSYIVPDIVGGPTSEMIGNKIAQRTFSDRNLPHASALSVLLAFAVIAPTLVVIFANRRRGETAGAGGGRL